MPRPVSDSIADGLPLWDTYEAFFFLLTGMTLGIVLGFLFPSVWRSFRRRFRKLERYKPDKIVSGTLSESVRTAPVPFATPLEESDDAAPDTEIVTLFVSARFAIQENALREAAAFYLQILGSEKVTRVQTNKAMFELSQVYARSGLTSKAIETGLELLYRKPTHSEVFRHLLSLVSQKGEEQKLDTVLDVYSGPAAGELGREVASHLSGSSLRLLREGLQPDDQQRAIRWAKLAVRWNPTAIQPKLVLIEATSVLWKIEEHRPVDQWLTGFCVDLAELARLKAAHPHFSPFAFTGFLAAWCIQLDARSDELEAALQRMESEVLSQLKIESPQSAERSSDYQFAWNVLDVVRRRRASLGPTPMVVQRPGWESQLRSLFRGHVESDEWGQLHECGVCSQIYREFDWRCRNCGRWESLSLLTLKTP